MVSAFDAHYCLPVDTTPVAPTLNSAVMALYLGSVQRSVLARLADAPTSPGSDVFDLRVATRAMGAHISPAVSRAVHQLVRRGVLEWMRPAASGFRANDAWESKVRYVRRGDGR
jgi:hypothetical protein